MGSGTCLCPILQHNYPIALSITTGENTRSAVDILKWVRMNHHGRVQGVLADGACCLTLAIQKVVVVTPLFFNKWQQVKPQGLNKETLPLYKFRQDDLGVPSG